MTVAYGRTRADVARWPDDPAARRLLEGYFDQMPAQGEPWTVESQLNGHGVDFRGADLSRLELVEAEFSEANLSGVRFTGANLYRVWMMDAVLHGADLSGAFLRKVQGRACDAQGAILRGADLERSEFEDADFRRADLRDADFSSALLTGADLRDADLRNSFFGGSSSFASFENTRFAGCRVEGARGMIAGPIDTGTDSPHPLDGPGLQRWFADRGAPSVEVWRPSERS